MCVCRKKNGQTLRDARWSGAKRHGQRQNVVGETGAVSDAAEDEQKKADDEHQYGREPDPHDQIADETRTDQQWRNAHCAIIPHACCDG